MTYFLYDINKKEHWIKMTLLSFKYLFWIPSHFNKSNFFLNTLILSIVSTFLLFKILSKQHFFFERFKLFVTMCNVALSSVAGTTCLGCCLLLSCAEVDCKKAQFFWLFKVRAQSSPSVQSARLRQCVPPHTRATVASAWISILSRIGANIFGFCGLSYIQGVGKCWEITFWNSL